jgi:uncharacterized protein YydD (DUF2326 family)
MLIRLEANRPEFKPINFKPGFNAIVADRDPAATDQDSRNARGKSTILKFINWVLAGSRPASLVPLADDGWSISLTLEIFGGRVKATRDLSGGSRLQIEADEASFPALQPYLSEGTISLDDWKEVLGLALFRLEPQPATNGALSVRTLLSYVVRTDTPNDPLKTFSQQSATSSRMHVSFLMGLDWRPVHELARIKTGLDQLSAITAATRDGLITSLRPESDLLLERASLRGEADEWHARISGFRVLEDPQGLVERANLLTKEISSLRDEAVTDGQMRDLYETSLADHGTEEMDSAAVVGSLFEVSGLILADGFKRRMDEVEAFHAALISNRRDFLSTEIREIDERAEERNTRLRSLSQQRETAMKSLRAGGALEELLSMQTELTDIEARVAAVDEQIEQARELESKRDELKLKKAQERAAAGEVLTQYRGKLDNIGERFGLKMKRLYGKDGVLTVSVDDGGFKFGLKVTGAGSTGVNRATMFCFDLTMLEEGIETEHHPDFLIHDSTVFDGVDPRQRAGTLHFAQEMVEATRGQYICTINSNDIPNDVRQEAWFSSGIVRTVLDTEPHGAIGVSF